MNNPPPLLLPYADVARSTGPKTPPEPSWPGPSLQLCRDTMPGLETQHGPNPWKPNSLRHPSKDLSGARKRPLADVTNADVTNSPNLVPSCERCEVAWTKSASSSQIVLLVDLDNWPSFFQTIPCRLPFHVAAFHRANNPALNMGCIHRSAAVQDLGRRLLMVHTITAKGELRAALLSPPNKALLVIARPCCHEHTAGCLLCCCWRCQLPDTCLDGELTCPLLLWWAESSNAQRTNNFSVLCRLSRLWTHNEGHRASCCKPRYDADCGVGRCYFPTDASDTECKAQENAKNRGTKDGCFRSGAPRMG